jgi:hypothetical protein
MVFRHLLLRVVPTFRSIVSIHSASKFAQKLSVLWFLVTNKSKMLQNLRPWCSYQDTRHRHRAQAIQWSNRSYNNCSKGPPSLRADGCVPHGTLFNTPVKRPHRQMSQLLEVLLMDCVNVLLQMSPEKKFHRISNRQRTSPCNRPSTPNPNFLQLWSSTLKFLLYNTLINDVCDCIHNSKQLILQY